MWVTTIGPHWLHVAAEKKKFIQAQKKKNFCVRCNGISGDVTRRSKNGEEDNLPKLPSRQDRSKFITP